MQQSMDVGGLRKQPVAAGGPLSRAAPRKWPAANWLAACWRRRWLRWLFAAAVVAVLYIGSGWWLPAAGLWLDVGETPRASDDCLLLSGDYDSRAFVAAALYRRGFIRNQIWLTHATMPDTGAESGESNDRARRILTALEIPPNRVVELPGDCTSTFDEAAVLARAMAEHPTATVTVVTSNYHTRRARWIIRRELESSADRVRYVSAPTDYYDAGCWWKVEEGFTTYSKEFLKNAFYLLWYGWGGVWIVAFAAVAFAWSVVRRMRRQRTAGTIC
jgi:uncharacterized SAM-binding protein YcdF (DUF218 family)